MTDIALPYDLCPSKVTWTLDRNVADVESPFSRVNQAQGRPGDRWRAAVTWDEMDGDKAHVLAAWLDQISKGRNYALLPVQQNDLSRSSLAVVSSLQSAWAAAGSLTGWTATNLRNPGVRGGFLCVTPTAVGAAYYERTITVTANGKYLLIFDVPDQPASYQITITDGASTPITLYDSGVSAAYGRQAVLLASTTSSMVVRLSALGGPAAITLYGDISLAKAVSSGGGSAGQKVISNLVGLPVSDYSGLKHFVAGQFVTVKTSAGFELKRAALNTDLQTSSTFGVGVRAGSFFAFEPALRGNVAGLDVMVFLEPWCRMRLAKRESSASISAPLQHGFSVDFVEEL